MNLSGFDSSSIGMLFSGVNNSKNSGSFGIDLSTYGLIRTGSYGKLLKSYYKTGADVTGVGKDAETTTSTAKDSTKVLASVEQASEDLSSSAKALYGREGKALFEKKTQKDADGKETQAYDTDAIYQAVDRFVTDYNAAITAAGKSNSNTISNAGASLVSNVQSNLKMLQAVGIKWDSSTQKLTVDESTFKKADMTKVQSLFQGNGSFAYATGVKASMMESYAEMEAAKSNTYTRSGGYTYNYSTGELYRTQV